MSDVTGGGSTSGSLSRQKEVTESFNIETVRSARRKTTPETTRAVDTERFAKIKDNPFYKIMGDQSLSPEEKRDLMVKALVVDPDLSVEENREKLEALTVFKEFMQKQRIALNERNMALSETGAFSELQAVLKDMNTSLLDFEDAMKPLTDILDSVYELRKAGKTLDVFKEIRNDREWEAKLKEEVTALETSVGTHEAEIAQRNSEIADLQDQRKFFGFGGIKESAKMRIAELQLKNTQSSTAITEVATKIKDTTTMLENGPGTDHPDVAKHKAVLREMLDITTDGHKDRQKRLVETAQKFVQFSRERTEATLGKFVDMKDQIQRSSDVTFAMQQGYAIVDEAVKEAEAKNTEVRKAYVEPTGTEGSVVELARQSKLALVNDFVNNLADASIDTSQSLEELQREKMQVQTMSDANRENIRSARQLSTSGVATIAGQLSAVLTGIGSAALVQSSESAKDTMQRMGRMTQSTLMKEVINNANRKADVNSELLTALDTLGQFSEAQRSAIELTRDAMKDIRQNLDKMGDASRELGQAIESGQSVSAEVVAEHIREVAGQEPANDDKKRGAEAAADMFGLKHS